MEVISCVSCVRTAEAVDAITRIPEEYRNHSFFSEADFYIYLPEAFDEKLCLRCRDYAYVAFFKGSQLRSEFKYLTIEDEDTIKPNVHPNCVLKGTLVTTNKGLVPIEDIKVGDLVLTHKGRFRPVIQLHRNSYNGKIYNLQGNWLTGNHPILTPVGWVVANIINNGDSVINLSSSIMPEIRKPEATPTLTNQKRLLSSILPSFSGGLMPVSTINFNSNLLFRDSKINIKNIDCEQGNNRNILALKLFKKLSFKFAEFTRLLNTYRSFHKKFMRTFRTSNCIMISFNLLFSLFRRHSAPLQSFRLALGSTFNSSLLETKSYGASSNSVGFGDGVLRHSSFIKPSYFIDGQINPKTPLFSQVSSQLTNICNKPFKGVVYNLSVYEDESYTVGYTRLAVHNCRCILDRITDIETYLLVMEKIFGFKEKPMERLLVEEELEPPPMKPPTPERPTEYPPKEERTPIYPMVIEVPVTEHGHKWGSWSAGEKCEFCNMTLNTYLAITRAVKAFPERQDLKDLLECKHKPFSPKDWK